VERLPELVAPILARDADMVVGSRTPGRRRAEGRPWHADLGTRFCVWLMNAVFGTRATDLGPFRAISSAQLARLKMRDRGSGWTVEMQVRAALCGLRTREVVVANRPRAGGRSKVSGTVRGSVRAAVKILVTIARHALVRHV
jgi:hypothetical protein